MVVGLLKRPDFAIDDERRMFIHPAAECTLATAGGNATVGNIFEIFDNDTTTYFRYGVTGGGGTCTITLDFLRNNRARVLWVFFGANAEAGSAATATLQISTDGTNWTNLDSIVVPADTTTTKTYTGSDKQFRYIRFSTVITGIGYTHVYEIWASIVE